ncbi:Cna B-type domain-containing protein [Bifidobacterium phasiani]|uniref:Cna B-type domain-containing protein n=1 Tax=Bifidobacterium phasiani TaxID=2834431 RepID=A0ABS6W7P3_9BIFI|nr:Cna B-type domain-containing protein [Bifidobacterium phasiani]MBW3082525.1 Cna B-type domain-containing protein [Bifidobacterium phasiani]
MACIVAMALCGSLGLAAFGGTALADTADAAGGTAAVTTVSTADAPAAPDGATPGTDGGALPDGDAPVGDTGTPGAGTAAQPATGDAGAADGTGAAADDGATAGADDTPANGGNADTATNGAPDPAPVADPVAGIGDTTYATLADALAHAQPDDTIVLLKDASLDATVVVADNLTIELDQHEIQVSLPAANGTANAFDVRSGAVLTVRNGSIYGTPAQDSRAVLAHAGSGVVVDHARIADFRATSGNGGAISAQGASLTFDNAEFGFVDMADGGGVARWGYNEALSGGAVYAKDCTIRAVKTALYYNNATAAPQMSDAAVGSGGAMLLEGDATDAVIADSYCLSNTAGANGGALYLTGKGRLSVSNVWFDYNASGAKSNGGAIAASGGAVTIEGSKFQENIAKVAGGALYQRGGSLTVSGTQFLSNESQAKNTEGDGLQSGGAIYLASGADFAVTDSEFTGNKAPDASGGAIVAFYPKDFSVRTSTFKDNSVFTGNFLLSTGTGGLGGAIFAIITGDGLLEGNTFEGNEASAGGALCAYNLFGGMKSFVMRDNVMRGNTATVRGGAIRLLDREAAGDFTLESGLIEGNKAVIGGGIDLTARDPGDTQVDLALRNVLITGNRAGAGGGIWSCPSSQLRMYPTMGGAVYGNTAGMDENPGGMAVVGDDIQYEGLDTNGDKTFLPLESAPTTFMALSGRALGGGRVDWYEDAASRYADGPVLKDPAVWGGTNLTTGLHAELGADAIAAATAEARLVIRDNEADLVGGGIASNSIVEIGVPTGTVDVPVSKSWADGAAGADSVVAVLYRVADDGSRLRLDEATLDQDGGWSHTFDALPATYLAADGVERDVVYTVAEEGADGSGRVTIGGTTYESVVSGDAAGGFTITNTAVADPEPDPDGDPDPGEMPGGGDPKGDPDPGTPEPDDHGTGEGKQAASTDDAAKPKRLAATSGASMPMALAAALMLGAAVLTAVCRRAMRR